MISMAVEYVTAVPQSFDVDDIEFQRNDGTWCSNNDVEELAKLLGDDSTCFCWSTRFEFVREATTDDHSRLPIAFDESNVESYASAPPGRAPASGR